MSFENSRATPSATPSATPITVFHQFVFAVGERLQESDAFGWRMGEQFVPRTFTLPDGERVKGFDWIRVPAVVEELSRMHRKCFTVDEAAAALAPLAHEQQSLGSTRTGSGKRCDGWRLGRSDLVDVACECCGKRNLKRVIVLVPSGSADSRRAGIFRSGGPLFPDPDLFRSA